MPVPAASALTTGAAPPDLIAVEGGPAVSAIVAMDAAGRARRVLHAERSGRTIVDAAPSPDGRRVAFTLRRDGAGGRHASDLYVAAVGRRGLRRVTTSGDAGSPVWAPDGANLAFARSTPISGDAAGRPIRGGTSIWTVAAAGGAPPRPLAVAAPLVFEIPGSWSPDGRLLAFTRCPLVAPDRRGLIRDDRCEVAVVSADGSSTRTLAAGRSPDFSPSGRWIVFASNRDRTAVGPAGEDENRYADELYAMNADGSGQRRLTHSAGVSEDAPRFSPDGARIVYTERGADFLTSLAVRNADGTCRAVLARARGNPPLVYETPDWSPRGPGPGRRHCGRS
jgi:Tol biopolymer transport system component